MSTAPARGERRRPPPIALLTGERGAGTMRGPMDADPSDGTALRSQLDGTAPPFVPAPAHLHIHRPRSVSSPATLAPTHAPLVPSLIPPTIAEEPHDACQACLEQPTWCMLGPCGCEICRDCFTLLIESRKIVPDDPEDAPSDPPSFRCLSCRRPVGVFQQSRRLAMARQQAVDALARQEQLVRREQMAGYFVHGSLPPLAVDHRYVGGPAPHARTATDRPPTPIDSPVPFEAMPPPRVQISRAVDARPVQTVATPAPTVMPVPPPGPMYASPPPFAYQPSFVGSPPPPHMLMPTPFVHPVEQPQYGVYGLGLDYQGHPLPPGAYNPMLFAHPHFELARPSSAIVPVAPPISHVRQRDRTISSSASMRSSTSSSNFSRVPGTPTQRVIENALMPLFAASDSPGESLHGLEPARPVVKISNIGFEFTVYDIEGWVPPGSFPRRSEHAVSVHFLCDHETGKTRPYALVELADKEAADRLLELRNGSILGHRELLLQLASPAKLLNQLFPISSLLWAEGLRPLSPTGELAVPIEIIRMAELAIGGFTQHTMRCPERPFRAYASLIAKFPWSHKAWFWSREMADACFELSMRVISSLSREMNQFEHGQSALKSLIQAVYLCPAFLPWQRNRAKQIWDMVARDNAAVSPLPVEVSMPTTPRSPSITVSSGTVTPAGLSHRSPAPSPLPSPTFAPTPAPSPDHIARPAYPPVVQAAAVEVRRRSPSPLSPTDEPGSPYPTAAMRALMAARRDSPAPSSPGLLSPPAHGSFGSPRPLPGADDSAVDMVSPSARRRPRSVSPSSSELPPYVEEEAIVRHVLGSPALSDGAPSGRNSRNDLRPDADEGSESEPRRGRGRRRRSGRRGTRGRSPAPTEVDVEV